MKTNPLEPEYIIEKFPYGWIICAPSEGQGIPLDALPSILPLMPKDAILCPGIKHHFRFSGKPNAILTVATEENRKLWEEEITSRLPLDVYEAWWTGLDVGLSSAAIFAILCPNSRSFKWEAKQFAGGTTPRDPSDFKRCHILLLRFPEWKHRLFEVSAEYVDTAWPEIVDRWDELAKAGQSPAMQQKILDECHTLARARKGAKK
jgi:hypothetical protein